MQGKLIVPFDPSDKEQKAIKKFQSAAHFAGVKLGNALPAGKELHVEATAKDAQSFFKLGQMLDTVSGNELEQLKAINDKKEAEKKAKEAKKK